MIITGRTRIVGIFGDPVHHSLSPVIQNAAFEAAGLDFAYVPFRVHPGDDLKSATESVLALNLRGVNITIPHKVGVMEYLDEIDPHARAVGAVNTVVNENGELKGYNTDGLGYVRSLVESVGFEVKGKRVVMAGAGGAARSILYALLSEGPASVVVANRSVDKARKLIEEFAEGAEGEFAKTLGSVEVTSATLDTAFLATGADGADLVVNTTSLGMDSNPPLDITLSGLNSGAVVSDIVYSPLETPLLATARALSFAVHDGLSMLIAQGAVGFELWTGAKAPVDAMRQAAEALLGVVGNRR
ncbi:MAG: shikimate dehydrogenase [Proteobacteria bacterium]|nr:shikimate dehydrogenase [Pseudomonadota bacterium]